MLKFALAAALALAAASPALATGKYTCKTPQASWKTQAALTDHLVKQGWQVRKTKVDGGCYEVYGTTPEGDRVEAYFDPASFEKLYVARRGEVLFKKGS
jgi:hypothetical protein